MKESVSSFLGNVLSVILGIAITFTIQGIINRSQDRKAVRSALELVRSELQTNMDDVVTLSDYLAQERASAQYFLDHRNGLDACPADSVIYHSGVLFADVSITLSNDALELLKMSSLFQKLGDSGLSMKIIRAYDSCESAASNINRHIEARDERFEKSVLENSAAALGSGGVLSMKDLLRTGYGLYSVRWLTSQTDPESLTDVSDVRDALAAIDTFLKR